MKCLLPGFAVSLAILTQGTSAQVIHVDASLTTGANDGSSWGDAFQGADGLRSALAAATPGSEIWATGGTYRAAVGAPVGFAVQATDVTLRGGFAAGETSVLERPEAGLMPTTLSGDALGNDDGSPASETDNALTVLGCDHQVGWTMERIQVEAARELGFLATDSDVRVSECSFTGCDGGGAWIREDGVGGVAGRVVDSRFALNGSYGLYFQGVAPPMNGTGPRLAVDRCLFEQNVANGLSIDPPESFSTVFANSIMRGNGGSGAIAGGDDYSGSVSISHCTIVGNGTGLGRFFLSCAFCSSFAAVNCIVWDNAVEVDPAVGVASSLVQGTPQTFFFTTEQIFTDYAGGDLRPQVGSPAIDAGSSAPISSSTLPLDFARARRAYDGPSIVPGTVVTSYADIGALERSPFVGRHGECEAVPNSTGAAGRIAASGSLVAAAGDVTRWADDLPLQQFGIFLASRTAGVSPMAAGPGTLCLGGSPGRFIGPGQVLSSGSAGWFSLVLDLTRIPQPSSFVAVQPGQTWRFQAWHRDFLPGGALTSQFTDAIALTFR